VRESLANYRAATAHIDDVTLAQIEGTDHLMQRTGQKSGAVVEGYLQTLIDWLIDRV